MTILLRKLGRTAWLLLAMIHFAVTPVVAAGAAIELPVPRATLYPADLITHDVLVDRAFRRVGSPATVFASRDGLIGKVAKRTLLAGQPIPINAVRDADVVRQGQPCIVVLAEHGLVITMQAMALQSGSAGSVVSVRSRDGGAVLQGTVQRDGTIRVGQP